MASLPVRERGIELFEDKTNRIYSSDAWKEYLAEAGRTNQRTPWHYSELPVEEEALEEVPLEELGEADLNTAELGAVSETTPLLSGSGAGAAAAAGTGVSSSTVVGGLASAVGAAAGGALLYTALKGDSSEEVEKKKQANPNFDSDHGYNLPGHYFIGPGNKADRPEDPVDRDDAIAKEHDEKYSKAKTEEDILEADKDAINKFDKDWKETSNLHSLVGKVGLGIKHTIEKHTGVIYPKLTKPSPISGKNI